MTSRYLVLAGLFACSSTVEPLPVADAGPKPAVDAAVAADAGVAPVVDAGGGLPCVPIYSRTSLAARPTEFSGFSAPMAASGGVFDFLIRYESTYFIGERELRSTAFQLLEVSEREGLIGVTHQYTRVPTDAVRSIRTRGLDTIVATEGAIDLDPNRLEARIAIFTPEEPEATVVARALGADERLVGAAGALPEVTIVTADDTRLYVHTVDDAQSSRSTDLRLPSDAQHFTLHETTRGEVYVSYYSSGVLLIHPIDPTVPRIDAAVTHPVGEPVRRASTTAEANVVFAFEADGRLRLVAFDAALKSFVDGARLEAPASTTDIGVAYTDGTYAIATWPERDTVPSVYFFEADLSVRHPDPYKHVDLFEPGASVVGLSIVGGEDTFGMISTSQTNVVIHAFTNFDACGRP